MIKEIGSYIYDETENGAVILECDKNISGDVEIQESFFGVPVVGSGVRVHEMQANAWRADSRQRH